MNSEVDFRNYVAAFNRSDFEELAQYYADNVEFVGRAATLRGRQAVLEFYKGVKSRLRETLFIQDVVAGEGVLVADMITELHALEDWLDFPTGAFRKGETRRSQNFIWYDIANGRFTRIRAAHYRMVDNVQRAMTLEEFSAYMDAFNRGEYDKFSSYYDPEVVLTIAGRTELRGPQAICDFYAQVKSQTRRTIQIRNFVSSPGRIAVELESEFLALQDLPDFTAGPMKKGDRLAVHTLVLYELQDGRFRRIRSASLRR
jgi:ketosteroid isomerase-like protein